MLYVYVHISIYTYCVCIYIYIYIKFTLHPVSMGYYYSFKQQDLSLLFFPYLE